MLAILATHPIQYQVPLWQLLARDGRVPFEVWYLTSHATEVTRDREFQRDFAWDLNMLEGYPYRFVRAPDGATPTTFWRCRVAESLPKLFRDTKTTVLWVNGWQVAAYWQAAWAAHKAGIQVCLRGESNNLAPAPMWKRAIKRPLLAALFDRVDHFLCIGMANRQLYREYGVPESKLHMAPYAVDNERFASQAKKLEDRKWEIRKEWGIPEDAFCVLFCGKFIPKKRPFDLIEAAGLLVTDNSITDNRTRRVHLLFVGSGELGAQMRKACDVVFDAESPSSQLPAPNFEKPRASFTGFLNQTEISRAYVAADVLVLPSDYSETWGLVVNEAMASGTPCVISDRCGCALDLAHESSNSSFTCGDVVELTNRIVAVAANVNAPPPPLPPSLCVTVEGIAHIYPKL